MRGHNVGVLVASTRGLSTAARNDNQIDRQSGGELALALRSLGVTATLLPGDDGLDLALRSNLVDACLIAAHGEVGGSGRLQALLELRQIPFAGPGSQAVAIAYDKLRARQILAYHSLPVPPTLVLGGSERPTRNAVGLLGWPCVLKPRRGSHASGVRLLADADAVHAATDLDQGEFLLERAILGREIQVVLVHGRTLGALEVERDPNDFARTQAQVCPPSLPRSQLKGICNLAEHAARALGLTRGATRVDILQHPRHNEVVLEVEALPTLQRDGTVAKVARAAGVRYEVLVAELLRDVLELAPRPRPEPTAQVALQ